MGGRAPLPSAAVRAGRGPQALADRSHLSPLVTRAGGAFTAGLVRRHRVGHSPLTRAGLCRKGWKGPRPAAPPPGSTGRPGDICRRLSETEGLRLGGQDKAVRWRGLRALGPPGRQRHCPEQLPGDLGAGGGSVASLTVLRARATSGPGSNQASASESRPRSSQPGFVRTSR